MYVVSVYTIQQEGMNSVVRNSLHDRSGETDLADEGLIDIEIN